MADHVRAQIRAAVASAVTGLATTGSRVFKSRVYPLEVADLPALLVSMQSETVQGIEMSAPGLLERTLLLQVSAIARGVSGLDDTLDQMCKEVETALSIADLVGIAKSVALTATDFTLEGTSEQPVGRAAMQFEVVYFTEENAPTVAH